MAGSCVDFEKKEGGRGGGRGREGGRTCGALMSAGVKTLSPSQVIVSHVCWKSVLWDDVGIG